MQKTRYEPSAKESISDNRARPLQQAWVILSVAQDSKEEWDFGPEKNQKYLKLDEGQVPPCDAAKQPLDHEGHLLLGWDPAAAGQISRISIQPQKLI